LCWLKTNILNTLHVFDFGWDIPDKVAVIYSGISSKGKEKRMKVIAKIMLQFSPSKPSAALYGKSKFM
jgi:hypothetical protein